MLAKNFLHRQDFGSTASLELVGEDERKPNFIRKGVQIALDLLIRVRKPAVALEVMEQISRLGKIRVLERARLPVGVLDNVNPTILEF
ncbi:MULTISPECIES: hypothetical protein [unclassified Ruegeria]|uniref:hypothetical protein n=1 Tax=unclassified Ruegeria TaxID=2625375 RepID=UPI0014877057|nr:MULTISPECIES: hypothetical protein [unclassified Ruegeria]NOD76946.1 hypothetical protein [Ruegeria sp. HKCCD4332]NOD88469.1 hypothetical protein [Ruegeria sp. HKCCD4318]NOE13378.1 hypothetical protein [Ruegeria sp. HKCCD4318-2]NOG11080.1 hypothetical protein [Ruegeria sp. HKCCD4315]